MSKVVSTIVFKSYAFLVMTMLGLSLSDSITLSPNPETKKKLYLKDMISYGFA